MYKITFRGKAAKQFHKLPSPYFRLVAEHLDTLAQNPRPPDALKLTGESGYRLRVGVYRILYEIDDPQQKIIIYRIKHRREVYR